MYCPACRVEYRPGFTRCADCDAELVASLEGVAPPQRQLPDEPPPADESLVLLWKGENPVFFGWLVHELQDAGIACHVRRRSSDTALPTYYQPSAYQTAEVRVFRHDELAARRILEDRERRHAENREEREREGSGSEEDEPIPDVLMQAGAAPADDILQWDPDDATTEAWHGDDSAHAKSFRDAFRELGIGYQTIVAPGMETILVAPQDAERAREIIQMILEPPTFQEDEELPDDTEGAAHEP